MQQCTFQPQRSTSRGRIGNEGERDWGLVGDDGSTPSESLSTPAKEVDVTARKDPGSSPATKTPPHNPSKIPTHYRSNSSSSTSSRPQSRQGGNRNSIVAKEGADASQNADAANDGSARKRRSSLSGGDRGSHIAVPKRSPKNSPISKIEPIIAPSSTNGNESASNVVLPSVPYVIDDETLVLGLKSSEEPEIIHGNPSV